jgi:glycosyltransferase involved in cell wall biosynthesis
MRILWPHNFNPDIPQAGKFMYTFANALMQTGLRIELMYLGDISSPRRLYLARERVRRVSQDFDITHAQFGSGCAIASCSAVGARIVSLRGSDWHRYPGPDWGEYLHGIGSKTLTCLSLRAFDAVIAMSNRMTVDVGDAFKGLPIFTVPDPINTKLFRPQDRISARQRVFGTGCTAPWVLFTTISKNNPIKRIELALESIKSASTKISGLQLKCASGISHAQMPDFVACCDVALCTSTHEGWPNSIKESMACGLPFVATDVSDLKEIAMRHQGCSVCDAEPAALGDGIVRAVKSGRDLALALELSSMGLSAASERLNAVYERVLSTRY